MRQEAPDESDELETQSRQSRDTRGQEGERPLAEQSGGCSQSIVDECDGAYLLLWDVLLAEMVWEAVLQLSRRVRCADCTRRRHKATVCE